MGESLDEPEELTIEKIAEACRGVLPDEDITDLKQMELEEALGFVLIALEGYIPDPEAFMIQNGLVERVRAFTEEELNARNTKPHKVDELDATLE